MSTPILLIGNHSPPFGGVPSHVQYLARFLGERGWDVHVLSLAGGPRGPERVGPYVVHRPARLGKLLALLSPAPRSPRDARSASALLRSPRDRLRAIAIAKITKALILTYRIRLISAYHLLPTALAGAWVSQEIGLPLVTSVFGEIYAARESHARHLAEVQYIVKTSRALLSPSRHCAKSFGLLGLSPAVDVIHHGIDVDAFTPECDGSPIRARFGLHPDDPVVLFVGRMVPEMGLHVLLAAVPNLMRQVEALRVVVVGARGPLLSSARQVVARYPDRVFIIADAPAADLPLYHAAATVLVAPSTNERACLGLAIAEAMATAKAVVASNVGGTPEVVRHGETGILVPPEDPSALAEGILGLLRDEAARTRMGRRGRSIVVEHFNKDRCNAALEQRFRELLEA